MEDGLLHGQAELLDVDAHHLEELAGGGVLHALRNLPKGHFSWDVIAKAVAHLEQGGGELILELLGLIPDFDDILGAEAEIQAEAEACRQGDGQAQDTCAQAEGADNPAFLVLLILEQVEIRLRVGRQLKRRIDEMEEQGRDPDKKKNPCDKRRNIKRRELELCFPDLDEDVPELPILGDLLADVRVPIAGWTLAQDGLAQQKDTDWEQDVVQEEEMEPGHALHEADDERQDHEAEDGQDDAQHVEQGDGAFQIVGIMEHLLIGFLEDDVQRLVQSRKTAVFLSFEQGGGDKVEALHELHVEFTPPLQISVEAFPDRLVALCLHVPKDLLHVQAERRRHVLGGELNGLLDV